MGTSMAERQARVEEILRRREADRQRQAAGIEREAGGRPTEEQRRAAVRAVIDQGDYHEATERLGEQLEKARTDQAAAEEHHAEAVRHVQQVGYDVTHLAGRERSMSPIGAVKLQEAQEAEQQAGRQTAVARARTEIATEALDDLLNFDRLLS